MGGVIHWERGHRKRCVFQCVHFEVWNNESDCEHQATEHIRSAYFTPGDLLDAGESARTRLRRSQARWSRVNRANEN